MIVNGDMSVILNAGSEMKINIPWYNDPHRIINMKLEKRFNCQAIVYEDLIKLINNTLQDKIYVAHIKQDFIYNNFGDYDVEKFFDMICLPKIFENFSRIGVVILIDGEYKFILLDAYQI